MNSLAIATGYSARVCSCTQGNYQYMRFYVLRVCGCHVQGPGERLMEVLAAGKRRCSLIDRSDMLNRHLTGVADIKLGLNFDPQPSNLLNRTPSEPQTLASPLWLKTQIPKVRPRVLCSMFLIPSFGEQNPDRINYHSNFMRKKHCPIYRCVHNPACNPLS